MISKLFILSETVVLFLLFYFHTAAFGKNAPINSEDINKTKKSGHIIEISFGASLLDIDDAFKVKETDSGKYRRYPVNSALFLFEWLAFERIGFPAMLNIPFGSRKVVEGDEEKEENVATAAGAGIAWTPFIFETFNEASLGTQFGLLACSTINTTSNKGNYLFPLSCLRLMILTKDGFSLYAGVSYAVKKDSIALMYGVGHRF